MAPSPAPSTDPAPSHAGQGTLSACHSEQERTSREQRSKRREGSRRGEKKRERTSKEERGKRGESSRRGVRVCNLAILNYYPCLLFFESPDQSAVVLQLVLGRQLT